MGKKIQIDEELFARIYAYHILGRTDAENVRRIKEGLEERMERTLVRRQYAEEHGFLTK